MTAQILDKVFYRGETWSLFGLSSRRNSPLLDILEYFEIPESTMGWSNLWRGYHAKMSLNDNGQLILTNFMVTNPLEELIGITIDGVVPKVSVEIGLSDGSVFEPLNHELPFSGVMTLHKDEFKQPNRVYYEHSDCHMVVVKSGTKPFDFKKKFKFGFYHIPQEQIEWAKEALQDEYFNMEPDRETTSIFLSSKRDAVLCRLKFNAPLIIANQQG